MAGSAFAADLPTTKSEEPAPPLQIDYYQPFYVKVGIIYGLNTSRSLLWAQDPAAMAQGNFATFPLGVGASLSNVVTVGGAFGVFVTRNISIDVAPSILRYVNTTTKGYNPLNPILPNGTLLAKTMPGFAPITAEYHFDNFGAFRPYLGAGVAVGTSFRNENELETGIHVDTAAGPVLKAGFDYMFKPNWGLTVVVSKVFAFVESRSDDANLPGSEIFR